MISAVEAAALLPLLDADRVAALDPCARQVVAELRNLGLWHAARPASAAGQAPDRVAAAPRLAVSDAGRSFAAPGAVGAGSGHADQLDVAEAADRLAVHPRTVRRWAATGRLRGMRLRSGAWLFDLAEVLDMEREVRGRARVQRGP